MRGRLPVDRATGGHTDMRSASLRSDRRVATDGSPMARRWWDPIVAPSGYRPLQLGDQIEGTQISYQYVLPSLDQPAVDLAFGVNLLHLLSVKPGLIDNLVS